MSHPEQQPTTSAITEQLADMPIMAHLVELRNHLVRIMIALLVVFLLLMPFARELYTLLSAPLTTELPAGAHMIATEVTSPLMALLRLTLYIALFVAMPYVLYQIWAFIAPGLYKHEKRLAIPILFGSIVMFYTGVAFAYFVVLKGALKFFIHFSPDTVIPMTDINSYLSFVLQLFLVFGATFEIPIVTLLLILMGVVSVESLADKRRYIVVGCFAVSAVVTPPDGLSMILLAVPMWLLFEFGLILARLLVKQKQQEQQVAQTGE